MGTGLSREMRRLLGAAVAVNRVRHDGQVFVDDGPEPDMTTARASHLVYGVGLRRRTSNSCHTWLETTDEARCGRSSATRALARLKERGMLAYFPHGEGYLLTAAGEAVGLMHERCASSSNPSITRGNSKCALPRCWCCWLYPPVPANTNSPSALGRSRHCFRQQRQRVLTLQRPIHHHQLASGRSADVAVFPPCCGRYRRRGHPQ
jgi:hypothetical protein